MAGADTSTTNNGAKGKIHAFTLPEQTIRAISEELNEYGPIIQVVIDTRAIYTTDPVTDLTDRNGGLPLVVPGVAIIR